MDADLEHPPELIPDLVKEWRNGFKIVTARRGGFETIPWFKRPTPRPYYPLLYALGGRPHQPRRANFLLPHRARVRAGHPHRGSGPVPPRRRALARLSARQRAVPAERASARRQQVLDPPHG